MCASRFDQRRRGTSTVELAVCLPMMVILTFGAIETTSLISLRQRLLTVAYEAARTTCGPNHTSSAGIAAGTNILTARGITGGTVTISPDPVTAQTATGTEITATVTAPFATNTSVQPFILTWVGDVTATVTMVRQ